MRHEIAANSFGDATVEDYRIHITLGLGEAIAYSDERLGELLEEFCVERINADIEFFEWGGKDGWYHSSDRSVLVLRGTPGDVRNVAAAVNQYIYNPDDGGRVVAGLRLSLHEPDELFAIRVRETVERAHSLIGLSATRLLEAATAFSRRLDRNMSEADKQRIIERALSASSGET